MTKTISILGSTGSVGTATMDVLHSKPGLFSVHTLSAQKNVSLLAQQAKAVNAKRAVIGDESLYAELKTALAGTKTEVAAGRNALLDAAAEPVDFVMAAIVGMAGLEPILAAIRNGKCVAIANKEPMVAAGALVMAEAEKHGTTLLPVDSEHNAVFQILNPSQKDSLRRVILTASGGPFREWSMEQMAAATPAQAIAHPNWSMGAKISVDSATMFNKGLEVIEAHHLFGMPASKIEVLIHPQSIVHSMVEYADGSVLAQMGASDMRVPIAHALAWPDRMEGCAQRLDFTKVSTLTFEPVNHCRFPAINLAYDCLKEGGPACIAFNAANEVAVAAFLAGRIGFLDIYAVVSKMIEKVDSPAAGLEAILSCDQKMRNLAESCIVNNDFASPSNLYPDRKVS